MSATREPLPARLFVALWPDAAWRARLAAFRDEWRWPPGACPIADTHLHLTLHFIGSTSRATTAALTARLAQVRTRAVAVRCVGTAVWPGGIAVLTMQGDAPLDALRHEIGCVLVDLGMTLDRRPFAPHVTLARRAARAEPPREVPHLVWRASQFALAESRRGPPSDYQVIAQWGEPTDALTD